MRIFRLHEIKEVIDPLTLIKNQEEGFVAYSEGKVVVPPVGYLHFEQPPGDCHIKFGYIKSDDYFVVKIATGFYQNPDVGLPVSNGMLALFSQTTGNLEALFLDEGYLTDLRTAAAGAIAAKYLAPKPITRIGIIGTGVQARLQLEMLKYITECRDACVWGRDRQKQEHYKSQMAESGFSVAVMSRVEDLARSCNLIVTATAANNPLLYASQLQSGTHVTAIGADAQGKQELDPNIFTKATVRVVDSVCQCVDHGDTSHAIKAGLIDEGKLVELGTVIKNSELGRANQEQITVADLTGVAVQDIQIVTLAYKSLLSSSLA